MFFHLPIPVNSDRNDVEPAEVPCSGARAGLPRSHRLSDGRGIEAVVPVPRAGRKPPPCWSSSAPTRVWGFPARSRSASATCLSRPNSPDRTVLLVDPGPRRPRSDACREIDERPLRSTGPPRRATGVQPHVDLQQHVGQALGPAGRGVRHVWEHPVRELRQIRLKVCRVRAVHDRLPEHGLLLRCGRRRRLLRRGGRSRGARRRIPRPKVEVHQPLRKPGIRVAAKHDEELRVGQRLIRRDDVAASYLDESNRVRCV